MRGAAGRRHLQFRTRRPSGIAGPWVQRHRPVDDGTLGVRAGTSTRLFCPLPESVAKDLRRARSV